MVVTLAWLEVGIIVLATFYSMFRFICKYGGKAEKMGGDVAIYLAYILRYDIFFCAMALFCVYVSVMVYQKYDYFEKWTSVLAFFLPGIMWLACFIEVNTQGSKTMREEMTKRG